MTEAKVALVTGGSRRIGRAIVEALAGDGWMVAIHANASIAEAEGVAAAIRAQGGEAAAFAADLADPQAVAGLMPAVIERFGPVTLLVNNASLFLRDTLTSIDVPTWNRQFSVNIRAPSVLAGAMATALPAPREGAIVNIVDQRVLKLTPEFYSYTLSKAALHAATRTMAQALAPASASTPWRPVPCCRTRRTVPRASGARSPVSRSNARSRLRRSLPPFCIWRKPAASPARRWRSTAASTSAGARPTSSREPRVPSPAGGRRTKHPYRPRLMPFAASSAR